jgi:hypothetical protein
LVEEVNQQLLVRLAAKELLEAEIGEGIEIFFPERHTRAL